MTTLESRNINDHKVSDNQMSVHFSSKKDEWETPPEIFEILDVEFSFNLDVCATEVNAKCAQYFTVSDNGLGQDWHEYRCWMNPPYGREISRWMRKAYETGMNGGLVICLVPARVDTRWWWDFARNGEIRFIQGRLKFRNAESSAPFPSAVVIFRGDPPSVEWWDYKSHLKRV